MKRFIEIKKIVKDDIWVILLDIIAVNLSYYSALIMRIYMMEGHVSGAYSYVTAFYRIAPIYTLVCLFIFYMFRLYGGLWRYAGINDINRIVNASIITCAIQVLGSILFVKRMPISYYLFGSIFQFVMIVLIRFSYRFIVIERRKNQKGLDAAMIVGTDDNASIMKGILDSGISYRPTCFLDLIDKNAGKIFDGLPIYSIEQLEEALNRHDIHYVFITDSNLDHNIRKMIKKICDDHETELRDYSSYFNFGKENDLLSNIDEVVINTKDTKKVISFSPPDISEKEIGEVIDALKSGWITTGPRTKLLERRLAAYIETGKNDVDTEVNPDYYSNRVVCLNSATAAEELNLRILGIGKGDEVIVPAYTYTASASAAIHVGATVKFVDIQKDGDPITHMPEMDYDLLEKAITPKTKAIITVDLGGIVCDYDRIFDIVEKKKNLFSPIKPDNTSLGDLSARIQKAIGRIAIVADCAHSLGARRVVNKQMKYCGEIADFTSFSFHAVKNFTTAEGGASTWKPIPGVDNCDIYHMYQLLSLHGQSKDALAKTKIGAWEYDIIGPWYKCNMTDIMAAIGLRQLDRYQSLLNRRTEIIKKYDSICDELNISHLIHHTANMDSSNHLYLIRIPDISETKRNELIEKLAIKGIATNVHYKPLPMMSAYKNMYDSNEEYRNSYDYYHNLITLPLHTLLSDEDVDFICEKLKEVIKENVA